MPEFTLQEPLRWPAKFKRDAAGQPDKVFGIDPPQPAAYWHCRNCGGLGHMYAFYAKAGPFRDPPGGRSVIKYMPGKGWFIGQTVADICPVCQNRNTAPPREEAPAVQIDPEAYRVWKPVSPVEADV